MARRNGAVNRNNILKLEKETFHAQDLSFPLSDPVSGIAASRRTVMADGETGPAADVRLTFRVGNTAADGTESIRTYHLTVLSDHGEVRLIKGFRVPIPTTSFNTKREDSEIVPITSFSYQNIGLTVGARSRFLMETGST